MSKPHRTTSIFGLTVLALMLLPSATAIRLTDDLATEDAPTEALLLVDDALDTVNSDVDEFERNCVGMSLVNKLKELVDNGQVDAPQPRPMLYTDWLDGSADVSQLNMCVWIDMGWDYFPASDCDPDATENPPGKVCAAPKATWGAGSNGGRGTGVVVYAEGLFGTTTCDWGSIETTLLWTWAECGGNLIHGTPHFHTEDASDCHEAEVKATSLKYGEVVAAARTCPEVD